MAWYRAGTVTVSSGSNVVTGTSTQWAGNVNVGDTIVLGSPPQLYEVSNVASNTTIALVTNYSGTSGSGQSYFIAPTQGWIKELADRAAAVIATYASIEQAVDDLELITTLISQADAQNGTRTDVQGWSSLRVRQAAAAAVSSGDLEFSGDGSGLMDIPISAIDSYEAGTFTPVIVGSITAGSASYTVQSGRYSKLGNRTTYDIDVLWSGHTGAGDLRIAGLPFTSSGDSIGICLSNIIYANGHPTSANSATGLPFLFLTYSDATTGAITIAQVAASGSISISIIATI